MSIPETRVQLFAEAPIFTQSVEGRHGASLPAHDVPLVDPSEAWPAELLRDEPPGLPEVSEPEVVRHFTRASMWNFSIDRGMYPLGSCTMKYNPKSADAAAGLSIHAGLHPYQPEEMIQGALQLMYELEQLLAAITGFARVTLQPSAGAQGELCGLMLIRAYHRDRGDNARTKILIPDTAHGTNPASCTVNGFSTVPLKTGSTGGILTPEMVREAIEAQGADQIAGIMVTNPSTLGLFEAHIAEVIELVHAAGGLVYMDGANLNAVMGRYFPGSRGVDVMHYNLHKTFATPHGGGGPGAGPVGVSEALVPFLPTPTVERAEDGHYYLDRQRPRSIGQLRAFYGNFGVLLRAYAYIRELGAEGLQQVTDMAVLNANYLRVRLRDFLHVPHPDRCMHEVIASDRDLKETGVSTMDVAKRLMDYGFHPPTVYFPLVVQGALMIEPTETETPQTLDCFVEALRAIVKDAAERPEHVKAAPHGTGYTRLDETLAARKPKLRWTPEG
jgi:glycine dehydrogenase subunit 2